MKAHGQTRPTWLALALAAMLALLLALAGTPGASAQSDGKKKADPNKNAHANCATGRTIPVSKISIQLWTFSRYIGGTHAQAFVGAPADAPQAGSTTLQRLEYVLKYLSDLGFRKIEPYSFHVQGWDAEDFDALVEKYGLKVPSRHMSTTEATWSTNLADAKLLGQRFMPPIPFLPHCRSGRSSVGRHGYPAAAWPGWPRRSIRPESGSTTQ